LTFFRRAIPQSDKNQKSEPIEEGSRWHSDQIYMAHFTISDIREDHFFASERFSRGALGLAGAKSDPYKVWLGDWVVEEKKESLVSLSARSEEVGIRLNLEQRLPPIIHGIDGLSQKGPEPGNASYYYSIVGQYASGEVVIGDSTYQVVGEVWKDHEYSTSALGDDAVGWDWFSIQLDDGSALMFFEIRRKDGSLEPFSSGTYIDSQGNSWSLGLGDWQVDILDQWTSPSSGATYPAAWAISIPAHDLSLTGRPMMADQELNLSTTYWEGAVAFEGTVKGQPVTARGYIELTGYSQPLTGRL
jgi:predicted secreted hydrolase